MLIGAHVSISKGLRGAVKTADELGANTLQFFTRNPRGAKAKELDPKDIKGAQEIIAQRGFGPLVAHAPYTMNLASAKEEVRNFSVSVIKDDLLRIKTMGVPYLVLHVGTHGGQGEEKGLELAAEGLKEILKNIPQDTELLLEIMAGEGTELGYSFAQIGKLFKGCDEHPQLGLCLDACHLTGAGYDLKELAKVKAELEKEVGIEKVKVIHLNDSIFSLGARRDRHAKLGEGVLGITVIQDLVCDKDFIKKIFILETPNDNAGYTREIAMIKSFWLDET